MQKYADREVFSECDTKFKVDIPIVAPSEVGHIHIAIFDDKKWNGNFITKIVVILIQLELQLNSSHIAKTEVLVEVIFSCIPMRLIRFIPSSQGVNYEESFNQLPLIAIIWTLN